MERSVTIKVLWCLAGFCMGFRGRVRIRSGNWFRVGLFTVARVRIGLVEGFSDGCCNI